MFCPKCGKQIPEGAKFCGGCGNPVQSSGEKSPVENRTPVSLSKKQPEQPQSVQAVQTQNDSMPPANLPSSVTMTQNVRDAERSNRKLTVILSIILLILILAAVGIGFYYFKMVKGGMDSSVSDQMVELEERTDEEAEAVTEDEEENPADPDEAAGEETEEGVVSDTNEVVGDTILENIPKAVYSYRFEDKLGNAELVTRKENDTEPEASDDVEPQYVHGIDGQAVYLDGTYGIKLSDVGKVGDSYTIAFWMKAEQLSDWSPFIHIGYDLADPNKRVRLWLGQKTDGVSVAPILSSERAAVEDAFEIRPDASMPNRMEPGIWYHIAFTVDASRPGSQSGSILGTVYVAGQYIGAGDVVANTLNTDEAEVYLGINRWDQLYPVAFDEVKIWDQVLDAQQIQELYNAYE